MIGKTCLITGATSGIGLATAKGLAARGATVIVVGRKPERAQQATESIRAATGNPSVEWLAADMSSQAQVRSLARDVLAKHRELHVLINNAGAMFALRHESADGIEMTLALNHLGPFLLTCLLMDALKAAAPARIVNVSSGAHEDVDGFDFDDPQAARSGGLGSYPRTELASAFYTLALPWAHPGFLQYARTKLANVLFTTALARRLNGSGVTANALSPGMVDSGFGGNNGMYGWFMHRWVAIRGVGVEEGAATPIHVAASPELEATSGLYFVKSRPRSCSEAARDMAAAERLWRLSEDMTSRSIGRSCSPRSSS